MGLDRLSLYRGDETEEELEAAYKRESRIGQSDRECDCCGEGLFFTDEVFVLEVSEAAEENGELFFDILREGEDHRFRPYMMHLECWEEVLEAIDDAVEDMPPWEADDAILKCSRCESTIGNFEPFVSAVFGEIRASKRRPNGCQTGTFEAMGDASPVCLACMVHVIEDHFDDWNDLAELIPDYLPEGEQDDE